MRRRPSGVSPPNSAAVVGDLPGHRAPLSPLARQQLRELRLLGREGVQLLADRDLLQAAQGTQPHVEDRLRLDLGQLPAGGHLRLWVVAFADDAYHLVEIDIDDDLTVQNLHAAGDRREPMAATPLQHDAEVIEKGLQCLLQAHHPRYAERVEHIQVERHPHLELGQAKELLHQQFGVDVARLGLEDEANILGQLIPHIG